MKNFFKKLVLSNSFLTWLVVSFHKFRLKRKVNIQYGRNVFIGLSTICEGRNIFGSNSSLTSSVIGYASYISEDSHISKARIGRYTSIALNVNCVYGRHPVDTFVSSHPAFFSKRVRAGISYVKEQKFKEFEEMEDEHGSYHVSIGNDVWIGANVSILDGITIGDGAIVAANALVNKNVAPYAIVGGVPAKFIKNRFSDEHIKFLLEFQWWNKEITWIEANSNMFLNIDEFYKNFKNTMQDDPHSSSSL